MKDIQKESTSLVRAFFNIYILEGPKHVIIHAGTNDLSLDSSNDCIVSIENLCLSVQNKFVNSKIGVSSIIVRDDIPVNDKIQEVNEGIKELCRNRNYSFIDNSNIKLNALNGNKLHLNTRGSALLASRFIKFLRGELGYLQVHLINSTQKIFG